MHAAAPWAPQRSPSLLLPMSAMTPSKIASLAVVAALLILPAAAIAQSAVGDQYCDPLAPNGCTHKSGGSGGNGTSNGGSGGTSNASASGSSAGANGSSSGLSEAAAQE